MTHTTAIKFDVFPNEMKDLVKFFNRSLNADEVVKALSEDELRNVISFIDDFKTLALNN